MSLYKDAKLILTPNGYKAGKIYALKPYDGSGDFDVVRATKATRVDKDGIVVEEDNHIPRLDYSNGGCPCILVEEQSTNLLLRSEEFDDASWLKVSSGLGSVPVVTANAGISPDGKSNADRVVMNLNGGVTASDISWLSSPTITLSVENTRSIFLKSFDGNTYNLVFGSSQANIVFKQVVATSEWQRFDLNHIPSVSSTNLVIGLRNLSGIFVSDTADVLLWQAQLEEGTEATSTVTTTSSTVTRNADVITVTPPIGTTEITETFEDNTTNVITTIPATYQLPVGRIKHIVFK